MLHHISMRQKIITMIAVMSGLFLVALDQTIISTALSNIVKEFDSYSSLGLVVTAYLLMSTVTVPIAGKFSDMFGRRPVLIAGVIVFTIGSLLSGISGNIEQLIAYRALQGIGGGIIMANAFTIVGDLFSPRERGRWQGLIGAVFALASVVGPLLGGWLTDAHAIAGLTTNWRWTFLVNVPIGIIAAIVIGIYCPSISHDKKPKIDYAGSVALIIALAGLVLAVDNTDVVFAFLIDAGWDLGVIRAILYGLFALGTIAFIAIERRAKEPILSLHFFENRNFTLIMGVMTMFGAAFLGAILYLTQFNQQVFGADATKAGLMLLPMITGMTLSSIGLGQVVTRTGRYKFLLVGGFVAGILGLLALTTLTPSSAYWHEAIMIGVIGVGFGACMPIMNLAVQNEFEQKHLGAATASTQLFRGLGSTIGVAILSGVLTAGIATNFADLQNDPYVAQIKQSPAAAKILNDGEIDANSALALNQSKDTISKSAHDSIDTAPMPSTVPSDVQAAKKQALKEQFDTQQQHFSNDILEAFTKSLHTIFFISFGLMSVGLVAVLFIKERTLRTTDPLESKSTGKA